MLPAPRDHDRAAVLGGVPDERDDHDGDEELERPSAWPNASSEWTSTSETSAVATVAAASATERLAGATRRPRRPAPGAAARWMRRLLDRDARRRDEQQHAATGSVTR